MITEEQLKCKHNKAFEEVWGYITDNNCIIRCVQCGAEEFPCWFTNEEYRTTRKEEYAKWKEDFEKWKIEKGISW